MSKKLYEENNIRSIGEAIRAKNGTSDTYTTAQMAEAIRNIETQPDLEELSASENGTYTPSSGKDGFSRAVVNVQPKLEELNVSANGSYTPSSGKDGFSRVDVDVPSGGGSAVLVQKTITVNGTYNALLDDDADGYSEVSVAVDGGGTASFDNILVGSTDPDVSIGTPGDMYIKTFVNRVDNHAYHIFSKAFYKSSQNIWLDHPDVTLPYGLASIRIKTHSFGGSDASIDVYVNGALYTNILYNTVQGVNAHYFEDIYGLFIGYDPRNTVAPDGIARSGWAIYPPMNSFAFYLSDFIDSPNIIRVWPYNMSVDFEFKIPA